MSIPITTVVIANIAISSPAPRGFNFNNVNFLGTSTVIPTSQRIRTYSSIDEVQLDFAITDEEYKAATIFFSRNPRPQQLKISRWVNVASKAELRSSPEITSVIATWQAVLDGSFRITIDGVAQNIDAVDFSTITTLDGVAAIVQAELIAGGFVGATCIYLAQERRFVITSGTSGATSTIALLETSTGVVGTDISGALVEKYLNANSISGTTLSQGLDIENIADTLAIIEQIDPSWYVICCDKSIRDNDNAKAVSEWCEPRTKMFFTVTNDINSLDPQSVTDILYYFNNLNRIRTSGIYSDKVDEYIDMGVASFAAISTPGEDYNFLAMPSGITTLGGLTVAQYNTVTVTKKGNVYIHRAGLDQFALGIVANDHPIGLVIGIDDLQEDLTNDFFASLSKSVPQTQDGYDLCVAGLEVVLNARVDGTFKFLASYELIPGDFFNQTAADRTAKKCPDTTFTAIATGRFRSAVINGFIEG